MSELRREVITLIGSVAAHGRSKRAHNRLEARRIAILTLRRGSVGESEPQGLLTLGYGDEDIAIEIRAAEGLSERFPPHRTHRYLRTGMTN